MLPAYAPPEFADRSILWNSVEQIEKARDSQLAREIEAALPRELSIEQQLALVRSYVKDNFCLLYTSVRKIGKFQNYLLTIAVNTCNNYTKKAKPLYMDLELSLIHISISPSMKTWTS